jgi:carboxymethylenebutenolidase
MSSHEAALKAAQVDFDLFIYPGAQHGFDGDSSRAHYDPDAAKLSWTRTVEFLRQTIG